jgi:hypothetical protein
MVYDSLPIGCYTILNIVIFLTNFTEHVFLSQQRYVTE